MKQKQKTTELKKEQIKKKKSIFDTIILTSLKNKRQVIAAVVIILSAGSFIISNLNIDVLPNLNRPVVTVLAEAHGLAPDEVEIMVTIPLESALNGAPGVNLIRSVSKRGMALLQIEFAWGSDVYKNRQVVSEKLQTVMKDLPQGIQPVMGPISSIMGEIQLIGIYSKSGKTSLMDLRTIADWNVRKRLLTVPGITNIIVMGGEAKEYQILVNSEKMATLDFSFYDIITFLDGLGKNSSGGFIEKDGQEFIIRNMGAIYDLPEIKRAVIGYKAGIPVTLNNIADVKEGFRVKRGDASINGKPGVILAVLKQPDVSTIKLSEKIDRDIKDISSLISDDVVIMPDLFKQSDFINIAINNVKEAIFGGSIMVAIILFLFLWNIRTTVITLLALPISLVLTVIILEIFGYGINTMTLGGLAVAIGLLVDDAIIDTENIFRRLRESWQQHKKESVFKVVFKASSEIRNSIILATLVVALVFIPLLFLGGVEGRLFQPMALAFIISLFMSLLVALTLTPVLCYYLLPRITQKIKSDSFLVRGLKKIQERNLRYLLRKPLISVVIVAVLFVSAVILVPRLGREFLPPFNEGTLTLDVITTAGTSLTESIKKAQVIEDICLKTKGVEKVSRRTGRSEMDEHAEGVHYSEMDITLNPEKAGRTRKVIVDELRKQFKQVDGVAINIGQPISHRLDHLLSGIKAEVAIVIYGQNIETLMQSAYETRNIIKDIKGIEDLLIETQIFAPEFKISIRHDMASRYGISVPKLTEMLELALNGEVVGKIKDKQMIFEVRVMFDEKSRSSIDRLKRFVIKYLPDATPVTLGMLADIYESKSPYEIKREKGNRRIAVQFNIGSRDLTSVVEEVNKKLKKDLKLAKGFFYEIGGRYESQAKAGRMIFLLGIVSLIIIISLLYNNFKSWILTGLIIMNIPLSFIGGIIALYVTNLNISIASLVGFIALAGIASRNGIMMISHFLHLMREEGEKFSTEMIVRGALERLVPVLMTVIAAIFALIPIVMTGNNTPGKEILFPVSVVIVGGLMTSTMLDILLTPVVFYSVGRRNRKISGEPL